MLQVGPSRYHAKLEDTENLYVAAVIRTHYLQEDLTAVSPENVRNS